MANSYLVYSKSALRVKARFYNKRAMVYVEGQDDIIFWEQFFDPAVYQVQDVGGCGNLKQYHDLIEGGARTFIIAEDIDYKGFIYCGTSPLVVKTYCHSIENMMYCPKNIDNMVKKYCRNSRICSLAMINSFYDDFMSKCHRLLVLDVANYLFDKGVRVLGDTCFRFLDQTHIPYVDKNAVDSYCDSLEGFFSKEEIAEAERRIAADEREERLMIKGHFLTEAIRLLVCTCISQQSNKNIILSRDTLYADLVECIKVCEPVCVARKYIEAQIQGAEKVLEF